MAMDITFPSAKVIIRDLSRPGEILLIKRQGSYEPAGGKVEICRKTQKSENLEDCARREVKEELGMTVHIDGYVGNYYFFWSSAENDVLCRKYSSCVVFAGTLVDRDTDYSHNEDSGEMHIAPEWVMRDVIINDRLLIDPMFVGLKEVLLRYCDQF